MFTGLTNGTDYTFSVTAANSVGSGPAAKKSAVPGAVPGAPTNASATAGDARATVTWSAPADDGGFPVKSYAVTASPGGATHRTAATTSTFRGLTNGTSYTFSVTATNAVGTGAASLPSSPVIPVTVPGVPTDVLVVGADSALDVSWNAPVSDGGSAITGYSVTAAPATGPSSGCTTAGATMCAVAPLTNGTDYWVRVLATNAVGNGKASPGVARRPSVAINCSFIGPYANLQGCDLAGARLSGANLTGANLTGANLTDADLNSADLSGADLSDADLAPAVLDGTDLDGADLTGANLEGAGLDSADLTNADLTGANLVNAEPENADLTNADLSGADLTDADLAGDNLSGANLGTAILGGVASGAVTGIPASLPTNWQLIVGYLIGPGAYLMFADLANGDLSGADLTDADLEGSNLTGTDLAAADLGTADLGGVSSGGVTGTPASLPTNWQLIVGYLIGPGAALYEANLSYVDLSNVDLADAGIDATNFTGANLTDANLAGARYIAEPIFAPIFTGVTWNNTTCPDGTNSDNDGDTCVNNLLVNPSD